MVSYERYDKNKTFYSSAMALILPRLKNSSLCFFMVTYKEAQILTSTSLSIACLSVCLYYLEECRCPILFYLHIFYIDTFFRFLGSAPLNKVVNFFASFSWNKLSSSFAYIKGFKVKHYSIVSFHFYFEKKTDMVQGHLFQISTFWSSSNWMKLWAWRFKLWFRSRESPLYRITWCFNHLNKILEIKDGAYDRLWKKSI